MTTALIVDWLGRGGIAQTTESWTIELRKAGHSIGVVTRRGRELDGIGNLAPGSAHRSGIPGHLRLIGETVALIDRLRPDVVIVQNYVIPLLEERVHRAARRTGARVVFVVHDHHLHARMAGSHAGLSSLVRRADIVAAHSAFVGSSIEQRTGRGVTLLPLPAPLGVIGEGGEASTGGTGAARPLAIHFGVLHRAYKGTDTVIETARLRQESWRFQVVGVGAKSAPGVDAIDRFVTAAELRERLAASAATLLPYRYATQSAAVLLAQLVGSVPVASAIGGIPEQIEDGRTGILLPRGAPATEWAAALDRLADDDVRDEMAVAGRLDAWRRHEDFAHSVEAIVA